MSRPLLIVTLAVGLLVACEPSPEPLSPDLDHGPRSEADVFDQSVEEGNEHFFFLPPIADREPEYGGTFNPDLSPAVEVCVLDDGVCADLQPSGFPLRFTMDGDGSEAVRLVSNDEHYTVNWHTRGLDPSQLYRLAVFPVLGGSELGHVDLEPVRGRAQAREGFLALRIGRTLPVKVRIETGMLCEGETDCVEEVVGPEGGTVTTPSGFAGADFPEGALDEEVVVAIERITPTESESCLPTDLEQAEGCYRFQTDPGPTTFAVPVTAGVCLDPEVQDRPEHDQFQLHKFSPERPEDGVVALPNVAALFIDCEGFTAIAFDEDAGLLTRLAGAGLDLVGPLARFLGPKPLGAVDVGFGGEITEFSRIGWARPLAIEIVAGDDQEAEAGTTLPVDPMVRVTAAHFPAGESPPSIEGVGVEFSVASGEGNVSSSVVHTDASGLATVSWTLGPEHGGEDLQARVPGGAVVLFEAVAISEGTIPADEITVAAGFRAEIYAEPPDVYGLAFAPAASAFPPGLYASSRPEDRIVRIAGPMDVRPFTSFVGEADPTTINFADPAGLYGDFLYVTANNRDGNRPGDHGGAIIQVAPDGSWSDFTRLGLDPTGNELGLGEPAGFEFGPSGDFPGGLWMANVTDSPADVLHVDPSGAISIFSDDGRIGSGMKLTGLLFGPGGGFGSDLFAIDQDPDCFCIRVGNRAGDFSSIFLAPGTEPSAIAFGPGGEPFGADSYVVVRGSDGRRRILRVKADGSSTTFASGIPGSVWPQAIRFSPDGQALFVGTSNPGVVYRITADGSIPANEITVPVGFRADVYAEVEDPWGLALAPEGSAFGMDLYVGSRAQDAVFRVPRPLEVVRFVTFVEEAAPSALAFADPAGPFGDLLYVTANGRDGGRDGDHGGAIEKVAPDGSWSDFTRLGLDPTGAELGLGEPAGLAFGPSGDFGEGLWIANVSDRPADILVADPSGDLTIHWNDGKFSVDPDIGAQTVGLAFGPGYGFGSDLYAVDAGPGCLCVRVIDAFGQPRSVFLDPGVEPIAMVFGPGEGPFGDDAYVALTEDRSESWILRVAPDGTASMFASGFPGHISFDALEFSRDGLELFVATRDPGIVYRITASP